MAPYKSGIVRGNNTDCGGGITCANHSVTFAAMSADFRRHRAANGFRKHNDMNEILVKIQGAFQEAFGVEPQQVTLETAPASIPAWDSMGHLSLASNLERIFGISLDVDELMEMENVKAIVRIIQGKLNPA
jgi:acyl carrier protein